MKLKPFVLFALSTPHNLNVKQQRDKSPNQQTTKTDRNIRDDN